jgi:probable rRNA maturation factor
MPVELVAGEELRPLIPRGFLRRLHALVRRATIVSRRTYGDVTVVLVTPGDIRILNRRYRRHDRVTDVLSFTYDDNPIVGELVICLVQAKRQAKRAGHSLLHELDVLVTHGLLHLAGHDHMKVAERKSMRALEDRILKV